MLASAYPTSDSQSSNPSPFTTTMTTTPSGDSPLFSIDRALTGTPSNANPTSNPSPKHEHNFEGSEHDGEEGVGEDKEEDQVILTITRQSRWEGKYAQGHHRLWEDQEVIPHCCICFFMFRPALVLGRGRWNMGRIGIPTRRSLRRQSGSGQLGQVNLCLYNTH